VDFQENGECVDYGREKWSGIYPGHRSVVSEKRSSSKTARGSADPAPWASDAAWGLRRGIMQTKSISVHSEVPKMLAVTVILKSAPDLADWDLKVTWSYPGGARSQSRGLIPRRKICMAQFNLWLQYTSCFAERGSAASVSCNDTAKITQRVESAIRRVIPTLKLQTKSVYQKCTTTYFISTFWWVNDW